MMYDSIRSNLISNLTLSRHTNNRVKDSIHLNNSSIHHLYVESRIRFIIRMSRRFIICVWLDIQMCVWLDMNELRHKDSIHHLYVTTIHHKRDLFTHKRDLHWYVTSIHHLYVTTIHHSYVESIIRFSRHAFVCGVIHTIETNWVVSYKWWMTQTPKP